LEKIPHVNTLEPRNVNDVILPPSCIIPINYLSLSLCILLVVLVALLTLQTKRTSKKDLNSGEKKKRRKNRLRMFSALHKYVLDTQEKVKDEHEQNSPTKKSSSKKKENQTFASFISF
jgi:hypothetical protein